MHRRYNPSCPPPVRPQRTVEGWMVLAIVLGLAIGGSGLIVRDLIIPAFAKVNAALALAEPGAHQ
jgi:hypothetical protein